MGWGSGAELMSEVITGLKHRGVPDELRESFYLVLIPAMQSRDWDTEMDCFNEDEVYDNVLRTLHPDWFEDEEPESNMKTLDEAIEFVRDWDGAFDGRDKSRFADFVPFERVSEAGLIPKDGMTAETWGEVKPWTEEAVLDQLRKDVHFALEKAEGQRELSTNCMFAVVNMWCHLLGNGLEEDSYEDYAKDFFRGVIAHYGWAETPAAG